MQYKIVQIALTPSQKNSIGEAFVAQPDLNREALLGRLFVIIEIRSKQANDARLANFLISELNKNYYQNDKAIMHERVKSITIEQIFESCLTKTNKALYDQISAHKFELNPKSINVTIGVIHENSILFSNLGKNRAFVIYKNKQPNSAEQYKTKEISQNDETADFNSQKIFSNLINGRLPNNGFLFFCNEALPEYVGSKSLTDIITTLPPLGAMEQIKQQLEQVNSFISFYGILIKSTIGELASEPAKPRPRIEAHESIHNLRSTEATTEKLLAPAGIVDLKHLFSRGKSAFALSKSMSSDLLMASKNIVREKMPSKKRQSLRVLENIRNRTIHGVMLAASFSTNALELIKDKDKSKAFARSGAHNFYAWLMSPIYWFMRLSRKNKIFLSVGLGCLILFFGNLELTRYRNNQSVVESKYKEILAQIDQKENQIESNLIPKNFEGAKVLASEVEALFAALPPANQSAGEIAKLKDRFNNLNQQIRQAIEADVRLYADLGSNNNNAAPQNLTLYDKSLYLGDSANKTIYRVDDDRVISSYNKSLEDVTNLSSAAVAKNLLYFWSDGNIFIYNLDKLEGKLYPVNGLSSSTGNITQLGVFSERVYLLAAPENQIYRVTYSKSGFGSLRSWLKSDANITNATGFYLDGNGYLTFTDGHVEKYTRGEKQDYSLAGIQPPAKKITAITSGDKYIYLADPEEKRIIVTNFQGQFQKQLQSDSLADITAMAVDESSNTLYALSGQKIYTVSLKDK